MLHLSIYPFFPRIKDLLFPSALLSVCLPKVDFSVAESQREKWRERERDKGEREEEAFFSHYSTSIFKGAISGKQVLSDLNIP